MGRKWHGSGLKTPQLEVTSSPGAGKYLRDDGTGLFLPVDVAQLRNDIGVGRREINVFFSNTNFNIPTWMADTDQIEICTCAGGGSGGTGGAQPTTTTAATGGSGGTGGNFNRTIYNVGFLRSLGTSLAIVIGLGGASVAGVSNTNGNNGNNGNDTTVTVGSTVVNRSTGGKAGQAGRNTLIAASNASQGLGSGILGASSAGSSVSTTAPNGVNGGSNQFEAPASGATGGGLTATNVTGSGANGGLSAITTRAVNESNPSGNAVAVFVPGSNPQIPYPGNGGGASGGNTGTSLSGGNGINGGGGGASGAGRTGSGASGKGGDGFCYIILSGANTSAQIRTQIVPGGRLTLSSTSSNSTTDITGATTLFYLPHIHNQIQLFDNTDWINYTFTSISIALTGLAVGVYDVFAFASGGAVTLELTPWTNNTTRAIAVTQRDGVWVRSDNNTRRLLGTIYVPTIGTCSDRARQRFVSNLYNRVNKVLNVVEATAGWLPTALSVWEPWGNRSGAPTAGNLNRIETVSCFDSEPTTVNFNTSMLANSGGFTFASLLIDSNNTNATNYISTAIAASLSYVYSIAPNLGIGYHYIQPMQQTTVTGTNTFSGSPGSQVLGSHFC